MILFLSTVFLKFNKFIFYYGVEEEIH